MAKFCEIMSKEKSDKVTIICSSCSTKETRSRGQRFDKFYKCTHFKGDAGLYRDTGHYPLCRECVREMASNNGQVDVNKFKKILKSFNRPFIRRLYERALLSKKDTIGQYFTFLGNRKYQPMTWKDSDELNDEKPSKIDKLVEEADEIEENEIIDEAREKENLKNTNFEVTDSMIAFWGGGFQPQDYQFLEEFYFQLDRTYGTDTPIMINNLKNIAKTQLLANKCLECNDTNGYDKAMKTLSQLCGDSNIKPNQTTGNSQVQNSYGEFIAMIEETEPIPKAKGEFADADGIKKYINKWFVRHFARMFDLDNTPFEEDMIEDDNTSGDD